MVWWGLQQPSNVWDCLLAFGHSPFVCSFPHLPPCCLATSTSASICHLLERADPSVGGAIPTRRSSPRRSDQRTGGTSDGAYGAGGTERQRLPRHDTWDCHIYAAPDRPPGTTPGRFSAVRTGSPKQVVSGFWPRRRILSSAVGSSIGEMGKKTCFGRGRWAERIGTSWGGCVRAGDWTGFCHTEPEVRYDWRCRVFDSASLGSRRISELMIGFAGVA